MTRDGMDLLCRHDQAYTAVRMSMLEMAERVLEILDFDEIEDWLLTFEDPVEQSRIAWWITKVKREQMRKAAR